MAGAVVLGVSWATASFGLEHAPRADVPTWLGLLGVSAVLLSGAGLAAAELPRRQLMAAALGGALLLRAGALFAPISLSDDIHRYLFDGAQTVAGMDPYAARPSEVVGTAPGLELERYERLNSPRYYTVYPPLAQLTFAAASATESLGDGLVRGSTVLRILLSAFDLLGVGVLFILLGRLGRPRWWALLYAWNPLVYWEVAAGGHTDALLVPMLLLATLAAVDERPVRAGVFLGLAVSAKLTALVVAPLFVVHLASRGGLGRALAAFTAGAAVIGLGFAPFASDTLIPHLRESLALFGNRLSFNAPFYYAMQDGVGYVPGITPCWDSVLMPALACATLLWLALMTFIQNGSRERFVGALAFSLLGLLLFARVVHPWYLLPVLALGVAARSPTIVLASLLLPLSYLRYDPYGREEPWVIAAQFLPILAALLVEGGARMCAPAGNTSGTPSREPPGARPP